MTPEPPPQGSFCLTALKKRSHLLSEIKSRVIWSDSYSGLNHPWSESGYHESHGKGHQGFQSPPLRSARGRQRDCSSSGSLAESGSSAPLQRPTGIWSGAFFFAGRAAKTHLQKLPPVKSPVQEAVSSLSDKIGLFRLFGETGSSMVPWSRSELAREKDAAKFPS